MLHYRIAEFLDYVLCSFPRGYSRIPVHKPGDPDALIGILLAKSCAVLDPNNSTKVSTMPLRRIVQMPKSTPMYQAIDIFQQLHTHMAAVVDEEDGHSSADRQEDKHRDSGKETLVRGEGGGGEGGRAMHCTAD